MDGKSDVGAAVRRLRLERGLSARELADRAGVSASYLSRLENGQVSPTVSTLTRLVQAMGQTLLGLFQGADTSPVVRRDERRLIRNRGVDDYIVTSAAATRLEVLDTQVAPGADSGKPYSHEGDEECVLVLDGELVIWVKDERYTLAEGDAITFRCRDEHRWQNAGPEAARVLWIITPQGY